MATRLNAITSQVTRNLQRNILPGINSGAIAAGGFGGSRQGIAQGLAIGDTNQGLSNALAGLYGNAYEGDQNRANQMSIASMNDATQRYGMANQFELGKGNLALGNRQADQSYSLGQGNLALGNKQADNSYNLGLGNLGLGQMQANQNFYTNQRGQDMQQLGLGANLVNQGNLGLSGQGQQLYNVGQQQQQAPWQALQQYSQLLSPYTGYGQTQSQTTPGASKWGSALGGAMTLAQLWGLLSGGQG